jgi:hypothetical protein
MSDIIDILNNLRSMNMANQDEDEVVVVVSPEGDDDEDYTWDGEQQPLSASQEVEEVNINNLSVHFVLIRDSRFAGDPFLREPDHPFVKNNFFGS